MTFETPQYQKALEVVYKNMTMRSLQNMSFKDCLKKYVFD